jgi:hypothetical protein
MFSVRDSGAEKAGHCDHRPIGARPRFGLGCGQAGFRVGLKESAVQSTCTPSPPHARARARRRAQNTTAFL